MKNKKWKRNNKCSRLTVPSGPNTIGRSSSHPNVATISFEDLSSVSVGILAACCGELSSCPLVLIARLGVPSLMGRGPRAGIISLSVIHIAIFISLHQSILSMVQLQAGGFWFSSSGSKLKARAPAILKATHQGEGNETCYIHARLQGCKSCLTTSILPELGQTYGT